MLYLMRRHAGSWMIKVLLFAITIVFVFWGVGSFTSRKASIVATVNDDIIDIGQYRNAYDNLIERYRQQFGDSLNDGMIEMLNVKKQAIDQLVNQKLILQEAEKLGMDVTETELAEYILNIPAFQANGGFDNNAYRLILQRNQLTPEEFEALQKEQLIANKVSEFVFSSAKVSDAEAREWYDWQNAKADVRFALFEPGKYKDILPEDEKIAEHFEKNKENYKTQPMINAGYVVFDPDNYKNDVSVDEDEVRDYYDSHISEFKVEKTVTARHILIKVENDADEAAVEKARKQAEDAMNQAKQGKDFAELARTYSQGPSKKEGGFLGSFKKNQMVKPFADKAFSMEAGQISEPVRTRFGWHIIKVETVNEETTRTLEQATQTIKNNITGRKAKNLAYDKADIFIESAFDGQDFVNSANAQKITILETGLFTKTGPDAFGQDRGKFGSAAFELDVDDISEVQEFNGKFYVIQIIDKQASVIPDFLAVKERVKDDLVKEMQSDRAKKDADTCIKDMAVGKTLVDAAAGLGVKAEETGTFARTGSIPKIGFDRQVSEAAFLLSQTSPLTDEAVNGTKGYYVLELIQRILPDADGFDTDKKQIKERLLQQKKFDVFQTWLEQVRANGTVEIKDEYVK